MKQYTKGHYVHNSSGYSSFQERQTEKHFFTASLANGMKERLYQVIARNCRIQKIKARPLFFHQKAAHRVNPRHSSITIVAIKRVGSNILFSCFIGPIRNKVLATDVRFPRV